MKGKAIDITNKKNTDRNSFKSSLQEYSILIVDDNPTNLGVIVDYLEGYGLTVLVSQDGESSLKRAKYARPNIILLDVLMPGIDGYETCRRLKSEPQTRDIPVIFMTALSSTEDKVKGFEVGAVDYVTKPIQPEEVLVRIKLHLQLGYMNQTLSKQNKILKEEIKHRRVVEHQLNETNYTLKQQVEEKIVAQKALRKLNEELEHRVEKRTIQLRQSNSKLQQEILERKQAEEKVRNSLLEKEVLLKEIYHRVKNNLLVVSSLLEIQSSFTEEPEIIKMFKNSQHRIHSMALVHEQLYKSKNLKELDFKTYLEALVEKLAASYDNTELGVNFIIDVETIHLNIETAHSCGLVVNELIANSLEHAFPQQKSGTIWLSLKQDSDRNIILTIKDNGIGINQNFDFQHTESLGLKLVRILTKQLEGAIEIDNSEGTCFTITFAELDYCDRISNCS